MVALSTTIGWSSFEIETHLVWFVVPIRKDLVEDILDYKLIQPGRYGFSCHVLKTLKWIIKIVRLSIWNYIFYFQSNIFWKYQRNLLCWLLVVFLLWVVLVCIVWLKALHHRIEVSLILLDHCITILSPSWMLYCRPESELFMIIAMHTPVLGRLESLRNLLKLISIILTSLLWTETVLRFSHLESSCSSK